MTDNKAQEPQGPDLKSGIDLESLVENSPLLGHVDGEPVILVRQGENIFAIGATCTHYNGPLAEGAAHPLVELGAVTLRTHSTSASGPIIGTYANCYCPPSR